MNQNQTQDPNNLSNTNNGGSQSAGSNANNGYNPATGKPVIAAADIPFLLKARYFGSGLVVGVFVSPVVQRTLGKFTPGWEKIMNNLTGQAEDLVEKSSDLVAKAKDVLRRESRDRDHDDDRGALSN